MKVRSSLNSQTRRSAKIARHARLLLLLTLVPNFPVTAQDVPGELRRTAPPSSTLTIDQAVGEALQKNLNIIAERMNVSIAEAKIITARLRPNPVFSYGGIYQDLLGSGFFSNPNTGAGPPEQNFRVDFLLERGGKRQKRIDLAENQLSVAQLQLLNTIRQLIFDVQSAFVDVVVAKENLALAQENLKALNGIVEINSVRVDAGDLAELELLRSRVAAQQFQNAVRQAELRLHSAQNRLQFLLGRTAASESVDVVGPLRRDPEMIRLDDFRRDALKFRPDMQALVRDQARSVADLRLQLAQRKIDYTIGAQFNHQYGYAHGEALSFYLSVPLPLFNRNQGEIARVQREDQQIGARVRALEAAINNEVETSYQQYTTARTLVDSIEKGMLDQALKVREITEYSYRRGEASLIEFLDAQRAFNDTMQSYNEARAEYARNLYLIDSVSGKQVNP